MADDKEKITELRKQVETAIAQIAEGGQSYKIGSRTLTRANLTELKNLRSELQAEESVHEEADLMARTYVAVFEGR